MPQIVVLPHGEICPEGAVIEAKSGDNLIELILENGIEIEHACEMACACTTCHIVVREGFDSLEESDELEDDLLDMTENRNLLQEIASELDSELKAALANANHWMARKEELQRENERLKRELRCPYSHQAIDLCVECGWAKQEVEK